MDDSLRGLIRRGDQVAFGRLFDDLAGPVYRHALRLTGDRSAAEDVVSATFLEAWRLRERLDPDRGDLTGWVFGIATNVVRNTVRGSRRQRGFLARSASREVVPDFADALVDQLVDGDRIAAVGAALRRLRPQEQEIFALCVWAELDYAVAAAALGIPVGTVRSRLFRARKRLRALADAGRRREPILDGGQVAGGRGTAARANQEGPR
jgi:RNA polymerase sigma-70 factor (ECF subfamily)